MKKTDPPIIVEQTFDVERLKVWEALTDRDQMVQWLRSLLAWKERTSVLTNRLPRSLLRASSSSTTQLSLQHICDSLVILIGANC